MSYYIYIFLIIWVSTSVRCLSIIFYVLMWNVKENGMKWGWKIKWMDKNFDIFMIKPKKVVLSHILKLSKKKSAWKIYPQILFHASCCKEAKQWNLLWFYYISLLFISFLQSTHWLVVQYFLGKRIRKLVKLYTYLELGSFYLSYSFNTFLCAVSLFTSADKSNTSISKFYNM